MVRIATLLASNTQRPARPYCMVFTTPDSAKFHFSASEVSYGIVSKPPAFVLVGFDGALSCSTHLNLKTLMVQRCCVGCARCAPTRQAACKCDPDTRNTVPPSGGRPVISCCACGVRCWTGLRCTRRRLISSDSCDSVTTPVTAVGRQRTAPQASSRCAGPMGRQQ